MRWAWPQHDRHLHLRQRRAARAGTTARADHAQHALSRRQGFSARGGLRVPLIVRWPGHVPAGRVVDAPVVNTDWLPTLLEWPARRCRTTWTASASRLFTGRSDRATACACLALPALHEPGQPAGGRRARWRLEAHRALRRPASGAVQSRRRCRRDGRSCRREPERVAQLRSRLASWRQEVEVQTNSPNPIAMYSASCVVRRYRCLPLQSGHGRRGLARASTSVAQADGRCGPTSMTTVPPRPGGFFGPLSG